MAAPAAATYAGGADFECDMLVLGAGPGGYSAAFRSADLGLKTVLVERYATLGGVCLNVGCIPSKALLHTAAVIDESAALAHHGVVFQAPTIDIDKLRGFKESVIKKLTGGLAGMAKARKVEVVRGYGAFLDANHVEVELTEGSAQDKTGAKKVVRFQKCIIAAGSQAVKLPFMPEDPRVVDSTGALLLDTQPKRMLVIGGGIIGLEMATVYSTLGARIDVVEMLDGVIPDDLRHNHLGDFCDATMDAVFYDGLLALTRDEVKAMIKRLTQPTVATIAATWDFDSQDANLAQLKLEDAHIVLKFKTDTYRRIPKFSNVY